MLSFLSLLCSANFIVFPYFVAVNITDFIMFKPFLTWSLVKSLLALRTLVPSVFKHLGQDCCGASFSGPTMSCCVTSPAAGDPVGANNLFPLQQLRVQQER